jgi:hypothetical protein
MKNAYVEMRKVVMRRALDSQNTIFSDGQNVTCRGDYVRYFKQGFLSQDHLLEIIKHLWAIAMGGGFAQNILTKPLFM